MFLELDVGLSECSKQWRGKLGAEVQSEKLQGVGREQETVLKVLAVDETSS